MMVKNHQESLKTIINITITIIISRDLVSIKDSFRFFLYIMVNPSNIP